VTFHFSIVHQQGYSDVFVVVYLDDVVVYSALEEDLGEHVRQVLTGH
jgi:hypothetical protein